MAHVFDGCSSTCGQLGLVKGKYELLVACQACRGRYINCGTTAHRDPSIISCIHAPTVGEVDILMRTVADPHSLHAARDIHCHQTRKGNNRYNKLYVLIT